MIHHAVRQIFTIVALSALLAVIGGCGNGNVTPTPGGLAVSSTVSQNTLTWSGVAESTYAVYRGTASGNEIAIASTSAASYIDTPPPASSGPWFYYVTAVKNGSESFASKEVSVIPPTLTIPTITVIVNGAGTTKFPNLTWTLPASVTGVTGYKIYRSTTSGAEAAPALGTATTASFADSTVTQGTTYFYRVTAIGTNGETLGSNEVSVTL